MILETEDTIAAIATPFGRAALGIIRISGKDSCGTVSKFFKPNSSSAIVPFKPLLGKVLLSNGHFIDEALLVYFQQPHSYTREDLIEITCHGNPLILQQVLDCIISAGCRIAYPGEFTYRAFLNGRLDLVQAGAVNELISADSLYQTELALQQLDGRLSSKFQDLRSKFIELIARMEANIDFSEEQHYSFIDREECISRHDRLIHEMRDMLGTFERGRLIRDGFNVGIAGKPNVGKSSLFNTLLGQSRAIVTPVAGTTRDYLREKITIGNYAVNLFDTAGIRDTSEEVEREGVSRSRQVVEDADLILFVLDGSSKVTSEDHELLRYIKSKEMILVCNKCDVAGFENHQIEGQTGLAISAVTGTGIESLVESIKTRVELKIRFSDQDYLISNSRHRDILLKALGAVERGRAALKGGLSEEFPLADLHCALELIGQITGEITVDEIYSEIFSHFCIGK